jgi:hypothetical protein
MLLKGRRKTPICGVTLIPRHCDVLICTTHSSGFRKPCIWTFFNSLRNRLFFETHLNCSPVTRTTSFEIHYSTFEIRSRKIFYSIARLPIMSSSVKRSLTRRNSYDMTETTSPDLIFRALFIIKTQCSMPPCLFKFTPWTMAHLRGRERNDEAVFD